MKQAPRDSSVARRAPARRTLAVAMAIGFGLPAMQAARAETSAPNIAVGYSHACARKASGTVLCWGSNDSGQLGDGTTINRLSPVPVMSLVAEIAVGDLFSCARKNDGTLWCWGSNAFGQLGDDTTFDSLVPIQVTALSGVAEVSVGDSFACARKTDGTLWCWGAGFLGDGTDNGSLTPIAVTALGSTVAEVSTGDSATCARKSDGTLWCWGDNTFGELGDGTTTTRTLPSQVTGLGSTVAGVSLGDLFGCARKTDGTLWCWGTNDKGELGDNTTTSHFAPAQVTALGTTVTGVSASGRHACARVTDGGLRCWGWNASGELGDGTLIDRSLPVTVTGFGSAIAEVSAGINHNTCARTVTGTVSCAGSNTAGQVGDGTTTNHSTPVPVLGEVATVPAVDHKTLALLALLLVALAIGALQRSAAVALLVAGLAVSLTACDGTQAPAGSASAPPPPEEVGSISFDLTLGGNILLNTVDYAIAGPNNFMKAGSLDVSHAATVSGIIPGLPAGVGYALTLTATDVGRQLSCQGTATFDVAAAATTPVPIHMTCRQAPAAPGVPLSPAAMLALAIVLAATGCAALRLQPGSKLADGVRKKIALLP